MFEAKFYEIPGVWQSIFSLKLESGMNFNSVMELRRQAYDMAFVVGERKLRPYVHAFINTPQLATRLHLASSGKYVSCSERKVINYM